MFYLIKRDNETIGAYEGPENMGALPWFSQHVFAYSMDHAIKHEGYSVVELPDGPDCNDVRSILESVAKRKGITVDCEFVPFSQSRNAKKDPKVSDLSLNWRFTVKSGRNELTGDYSQGIGYSPAYKKHHVYGRGFTIDEFNSILHEVETGRKLRAPAADDILHSLALDSDVIDYDSFEDWASSMGYETDSRSAEKTYRACLDIALKLRSMLGSDGLAELQTVARYD